MSGKHGMRLRFAVIASEILTVSAALARPALAQVVVVPAVRPAAGPSPRDDVSRVAGFGLNASGLQFAAPSVRLETNVEETSITASMATRAARNNWVWALGGELTADLPSGTRTSPVASTATGVPSGVGLSLIFSSVHFGPRAAEDVANEMAQQRPGCFDTAAHRQEALDRSSFDSAWIQAACRREFDRLQGGGSPLLLSARFGLSAVESKFLDTTMSLAAQTDRAIRVNASVGLGAFVLPNLVMGGVLEYRRTAEEADETVVCRPATPMTAGSAMYTTCENGRLRGLQRGHTFSLRAEARWLPWSWLGINPSATLRTGIQDQDDPTTAATESVFRATSIQVEAPFYFRIGGTSALNFGFRPRAEWNFAEPDTTKREVLSLSVFLGGTFAIQGVGS